MSILYRGVYFQKKGAFSKIAAGKLTGAFQPLRLLE